MRDRDFAQAHNDYLDPDRHLNAPDDEILCPDCGVEMDAYVDGSFICSNCAYKIDLVE